VAEDDPEWRNILIRCLSARQNRALLDLNRNNWDSDEAYYAAIKRNPLALKVKLADIADNADEARLALLPPNTADRLRRKYAKALEALT
jgi:hypothetical protein